MEPSQFALKVFGEMKTGKNLLELGCGNGRDSLFFLSAGLNVTAIDASEVAIKNLINLKIKNSEFVCGDFVNSPSIYSRKYDYCYSRFSIHSITAIQESLLLSNVKKSLTSGGKFFVEVRSVNDELFGKGQRVGKNSFIYNNHFRRFIEKGEFEENLRRKGFKIQYSEENINFAPFGKDNPPVIRIVAVA